MMLEHLVIENLTWINRKARQYYSDEFDAEDLASETIEKILRSKTKFDAAKSFRPWALAIMQNTYITQYNRRKCIGFTCMILLPYHHIWRISILQSGPCYQSSGNAPENLLQ